MPFGVPDTRQFPWDEALSNHLGQLNDPLTGGINSWSTRPTMGVDGQTLGTNHAGYAGINLANPAIEEWDGTKWVNLIRGSLFPEQLQLSLYVNQSTGNDSNNGFTSSTAWKTIGKMYQELGKYNLLERQVNLYLGAGVYNIDFPQSTMNGRLTIQGQSSGSVTIQSLLINRGQHVMLSGVTLAYPSVPSTASWITAHVDRSSILLIRNDVVLGSIGSYSPQHARWYFYASNNSSVNMYANCPVTVNGDVNALALLDGSTLAFWNYQAAAEAIVYPDRAPAIDKGVEYTTPGGSNGPSNTTALLNFTGTRVVDQMFDLRNAASINGNGGWLGTITGSVTGKAYRLVKSSIFGSTSVITPSAQGLVYPSSISAGSKDTDSYIGGSVGI